MNAKEKVRVILFTGFFLFVILPLGLGLIGYINSPDPSIEQWANLFESAVVPWWIGIAETSGVLLVIVFIIVKWADAEGIL